MGVVGDMEMGSRWRMWDPLPGGVKFLGGAVSPEFLGSDLACDSSGGLQVAQIPGLESPGVKWQK
jgi:hypothetical protein